VKSGTDPAHEILFRCHVLPEVDHLHSKTRSTPYIANRTLPLLQQAFDQAERWGWRQQNTNPALHIDRYPEERRGARKEVMLTPVQMAALLEAIDAEEDAGTNPFACAAIRVTFWTGWRIGEVLALEWSDLDLEVGSAKLLRTKTAAEEYRQLPAEAVAILEKLPRFAGSPYVFPGRNETPHLTTVRKPWASIRKRAGLADLEGLGPLRLHDFDTTSSVGTCLEEFPWRSRARMSATDRDDPPRSMRILRPML